MKKGRTRKTTEDFIGDYEKKIEREIKDPNRSDILKFYKFMKNRGAGGEYRLTILRNLHRIAKFFDKPFKEVTRDDMVEYMDYLRKPRKITRGDSERFGTYSRNTINSHVRTIKPFFSWLYELPKKTFPLCVAWIEGKAVAGKINKEDIITVDELKKMITACTNDRDRAFLQVLFETGSRISGFMDIKRKDIAFDSFGAIVRIRTEKQKEEENPLRSVRIESSVPALERWLRQIPDDPEQPLWAKLINRGKKMSYKSAYHIIKTIGKRSGIGKNVHPHIFRHSSVTYWHAKGLPEGVLKQRVGWKPGSNMLDRYSHIGDAEADNATLRILGYETNGNGESIKKKTCPRCGTENEFTSFCSRCSLPLDDRASEQLVKEKEEFEELRVFKKDFDKLVEQKLKEILRERGERIKN